MRLICPNCDAQYEVADSVIPDEGRDVQCSNCGHTWFQKSAMLDAELAEELDLVSTSEDWEIEETVQEEPEIPEPDYDDTEPAYEDIAYEDDEELPPPAPVAVAPRRMLDENLLGILREEAALESRARRGAMPEPLETQPDLGLEDTDQGTVQRAAASRERISKMRGIESDEPVLPTRRDLLPDIEEINSTLRATSDRKRTAKATRDLAPDTVSNAGFRLGFGLMLTITVVLIMVYSYAPGIANRFPVAEPALGQYVERVNVLRHQLDQTVQRTINRLKG